MEQRCTCSAHPNDKDGALYPLTGDTGQPRAIAGEAEPIEQQPPQLCGTGISLSRCQRTEGADPAHQGTHPIRHTRVWLGYTRQDRGLLEYRFGVDDCCVNHARVIQTVCEVRVAAACPFRYRETTPQRRCARASVMSAGARRSVCVA